MDEISFGNDESLTQVDWTAGGIHQADAPVPEPPCHAALTMLCGEARLFVHFAGQFSQSPRHPARTLQLMLPHADNSPAHFSQFTVDKPVARFVALYFFRPKFLVVFRDVRMFGASMPETAMEALRANGTSPYGPRQGLTCLFPTRLD